MRKVRGEYPAPSDVPSSGRCLTPSESDTQAVADAGAVRRSVRIDARGGGTVSDTFGVRHPGRSGRQAVRNSVRIDAPGGGTVSDSEGVRHPWAAARLAANAGPCGTQLGLMRVIFEPSSPTPAI